MPGSIVCRIRSRPRSCVFIDPDEFFAFAGILREKLVGDAIKPGGKFRFASKTPNVFVSANESFLREIIRQFHVGPHQLAQKTAHGRLMAANQLAKSVLVTINNNSCEQVGIGQLHIIVSTLSRRDKQVATPADNRDLSSRESNQGPDAVFPIGTDSEKHDYTHADRDEHDAAA